MPSSPSTSFSLTLRVSATILALLHAAYATIDHQNDHKILFNAMSEPTKMYEPYGSGRVGVVEPFIYGPRMARLLARTTDGGGSTDTSSSTSTSSGSKHAINPVAPAFIAVAVFVVCTLVIFKGVRALRGHGVVPVYRKHVEDGDGPEKPRMWEVHLNQPAAPPCAPAGDGWSKVMPVAVEYLPPYEPLSPPLSSGPVRPPLRSASVSPSRGSRSLSRDTLRSSWSTFPEKRSASLSKEPRTEDDSARMRVAVIIAMPSPPPSSPESGPAPPAPAYLGLAHV